MDLQIRGRSALVCGGSRGIGYACAERLLDEGVRVAIVGRDAEALRSAQMALHALGEVVTVQADLSTEEGTRSAFEDATRQFGRVDILVNNGGGPRAGKFDQLSDIDWWSAFELVMMNTVRMTRMVLPGMASREWGRVINIMSTSVKQPVDNLMLSNSIRMAVVGLMKTLTFEYPGKNITFNTVAPGFTKTGRLESLAKSNAESSGESEEKIFEGWSADVPLRRVARPEEVAAAAVFLASEVAGYINGVVLPVDGGRVRASL